MDKGTRRLQGLSTDDRTLFLSMSAALISAISKLDKLGATEEEIEPLMRIARLAKARLEPTTRPLLKVN